MKVVDPPRMKVAFVYSNPRDDLPEVVASGEVPDSTLLGQNHMQSFGIDASIHRPRLRRTERRAGIRHRLTWNLREFPLPWELGDADAVCTPLVNIFPLTARLRGRPRVLLLNFGIPTLWGRSSRARRRFLRASLESVDWIVCLAAAHRERLVDEIGLDPARVFVAELGVDGEFFRPQPVEQGGYVLAMGKDLARDYRTFLEAVRGIGVHVVVVTAPHLLEGLKLPANVELRTHIPWPEMPALYAGARCFALPIHAEGYRYGTDASGLTALLEAMATARPIVATERAVFADYVEQGRTALLVPPDDPAALREAIERVLSDDALATTLAAGARASVDERLTTTPLRRPPGRDPARELSQPVNSMPLRRIVSGPAPAPDRIAFHALWFGDHNNQRYDELLPRLRRVDPYLVTVPDRRPLRGLAWRAWKRTQPVHQRAILGALARRYRSFFVTDPEQIANIDLPVVIDVDDPWYSPREVELMMRPNVAAYVVTGESAIPMYEQFGLDKPCHVIPQGVSFSSISTSEVQEVAARRRPGELIVGWVAAYVLTDGDHGGSNALYNVDHLLELWESIHERVPAARLWLFGTPGRRLRERLRGRDDVVLFGRLPRPSLLAHVANFDLAVYPRRKGGGIQTVKIAEFMGLGVPTVAYDYRTTWVLRDTGAGVLVRTPAEFVGTVERLARNPVERSSLAAAARRAGQDLDWDVLARRYEDILDRYLP